MSTPDQPKSLTRAPALARPPRFVSGALWARCAGYVLVGLAIGLAVWGAIDALLPLPDWYASPIHLWPPKFRCTWSSGTWPDKGQHAAFYFVLVVVFAFGITLVRRGFNGRPVVRFAAILALAASLVEAIQALLPYRNCEVADAAADTAGLAAGLACVFLLLRVHRGMSVTGESSTATD